MKASLRLWILVGALAVVVTAAAVYTRVRAEAGDLARLVGQLRPASEEASMLATAAVMEVMPDVVTASGTLVPAQWARLSFPLGGRVAAIFVREGDAVQAGQTLIQLDAGELFHAAHQAQATLEAARAELARLEAGARPEEIAAAEAALRAAEAELARLKAGPKPEEIAAAKAEMEKAEAVMRAAQSEYDKIAWMADAAAMPQAVALEQATAAYEAARSAYEALLRGATEEEIAVAQARVDQARARLALLRAGATSEEIQAARARVDAAQAALELAQTRLNQATLQAPFAGTVARVDVRTGETVAPSQPVIILGDLSTLQLETDDLSEEDIAQVQVGAPVTVTLDALPERAFRGRVIAIAPMADVDQGGTNYKVTVALEERDPAMRWGMTAYVEISVRP